MKPCQSSIKNIIDQKSRSTAIGEVWETLKMYMYQNSLIKDGPRYVCAQLGMRRPAGYNNSIPIPHIKAKTKNHGLPVKDVSELECYWLVTSWHMRGQSIAHKHNWVTWSLKLLTGNLLPYYQVWMIKPESDRVSVVIFCSYYLMLELNVATKDSGTFGIGILECPLCVFLSLSEHNRISTGLKDLLFFYCTLFRQQLHKKTSEYAELLKKTTEPTIIIIQLHC